MCDETKAIARESRDSNQLAFWLWFCLTINWLTQSVGHLKGHIVIQLHLLSTGFTSVTNQISIHSFVRLQHYRYQLIEGNLFFNQQIEVCCVSFRLSTSGRLKVQTYNIFIIICTVNHSVFHTSSLIKIQNSNSIILHFFFSLFCQVLGHMLTWRRAMT